MLNSEFDNLVEHPVRTHSDLLELRQNEEGYQTETSYQKSSIENNVLARYLKNVHTVLNRAKIVEVIKRSLMQLEESYVHLDCSRPWMCFWGLHSLDILGERLRDEEHRNIVSFLAKCQSPAGGFGGGPGQYSHLASTYAAINALCIIGTPEAYQIIDRKALKRFVSSLHEKDGSFRLHVDGEVDLRGVYCAIAVAKLTNIYTPEMVKNTVNWIAKCQTWEGGFGGVPGAEAHGGYTFCALATLTLLEKTEFCHLDSLVRWIINKQSRLEGGFQGRTNKLVDSCYSFWQGATFIHIEDMLDKNHRYWLFNQEALQEFILISCQHALGGFVDKPTRPRDLYHTCYALSGLSVAQNSLTPIVIGSRYVNLVKEIDPLYNLPAAVATKTLKYFSTLPIPN